MPVLGMRPPGRVAATAAILPLTQPIVVVSIAMFLGIHKARSLTVLFCFLTLVGWLAIRSLDKKASPSSPPHDKTPAAIPQSPPMVGPTMPLKDNVGPTTVIPEKITPDMPIDSQPSPQELTLASAERGTVGLIQMRIGVEQHQGRLNLSRDQEETLINTFVAYLHLEGVLEKSAARIDSYDGTTLNITIPPYTYNGAPLDSVFYDELSRKLSPEVSQAIKTSLGNMFAGQFRHFGAEEQHLKIFRSPNDSKSVEIDWSMGPGYGMATVDPETIMSGGFEGFRAVIGSYFWTQ